MQAGGEHGPQAVRHAVCFEEAGECTLDRIARAARPGDSVLVLGPEPWSEALRAVGLPRDVAIITVGRTGGAWRFDPVHDPRAAAPMVLAYGPQAQRVSGRGAALAQAPDTLPTAPDWPKARRDRIRRELGIAPLERALLVAGEPSEWIDLSFVARAVGMAFVGGAPLRMVVSPRVPRIAEVDAFLGKATGSAPIIVDARADRPWELLPALDGAIVDRDGAVERPVDCAGWRAGAWQDRGWRVSPLPALWAIACGVPAFVHESIDLGAHGLHPGVTRFARGIAPFADALGRLAATQRENKASAASR